MVAADRRLSERVQVGQSHLPVRESRTMNIGFVGLGTMGALIVPRLMAAGHHVTGWNRSREKATPLITAGMVFADTPRAAAAGSEIVFSIVTDATAVKA
ncbi:MAG: NAD(P)-binding domain-containing protein, partial [Xanthobacteraceae bacterium]